MPGEQAGTRAELTKPSLSSLTPHTQDGELPLEELMRKYGYAQARADGEDAPLIAAAAAAAAVDHVAADEARMVDDDTVFARGEAGCCGPRRHADHYFRAPIALC